uniref:Immunoglobulin domain-containing protein n=1 Tax=Salmo trutta TaxID=8032 RepID=A0A674A276_SALTR
EASYLDFSTERSLKVFSVAVSAGTQLGAYSVSTVSKVSVKTGNYITIPCRYDQRYIQYVKYWCQGDYWNSLTSQQIIDHNNRHILTVTLNGLNMGDTGWYWCSRGDLQMPVHITILLNVNSNLNVFCVDVSTGRHVSVQTGGSITFPCSYDLNHINHVKYWCKGLRWDACSYVVRTDHPKSSGKTSISDDINKRIFTVTMTDLTSWDYGNYRYTGWYWCSRGDLQMPVHITVNQLTTTQTDTIISK